MIVFENRAVRALPVDPSEQNRSRQVSGACFSRVHPTPVAAPRTLAVAREVADRLDLDEAFVQSEQFARVFAGNELLPGMDPVSACYGGHQFGTWAGQLGDGRAITLGEIKNARGEHWEIQLKGAGPTPYSRRADGRAVLRSSLREFLCSEAMHHLGIPTTRALALVATGESVVRDILYDGHPRPELGAVVTRAAPSFLRFGNFEIFAHRGEHDVLRRLADFALTTYFPELGAPSSQTYVAWFREVTRRTAELMAHWMAVGFVHGVMNTDNMSVLGLTIDYGPYGFLDDYDPDWTPNITDAQGRRYRYGNQPRVALWNLAQFAYALAPLVDDDQALDEALGTYSEVYNAARRRSLSAKLGLTNWSDEELGSAGGTRVPDATLVEDLFQTLSGSEIDFTLFFRALAGVSRDQASTVGDDAVLLSVQDSYYDFAAVSAAERAKMATWLRRYSARLTEQNLSDEARRVSMNAVNPKYVLRNYVAQLAIDSAEKGDSGLIGQLLDVFRRPFDEQPDADEYARKRPDWARDRPGCSMLSCSS